MKCPTPSFLHLASLLLWAASCGPPAVNPDSIFTIRGVLQNANGLAAGDTDFKILKTDNAWDREDNILNNPSLPGTEQPFTSTYTGRSFSDGSFEMELRGNQVNQTNGKGAAYLAVLFEEEGSSSNLMATATEWHNFRDTNPTWDAGTLALWDGGSARQSQGVVTFSMNGNDGAAPIGNTRDTTRPAFMMAYPVGSNGLQWAGQTLGSSMTAPRSAFDPGVSPDFFFTTFSQESSGSRTYKHRSSWKVNAISAWSSSTNVTNYLTESWGAEVLDADLVTMPGAFDDNLGTPFEWTTASNATEFFVDLSVSRSVQDIIVYDLGVENYQNATLSISISSDSGDLVPATWEELETWDGHDGFIGEGTVPWLYMGVSGNYLTRWIRIEVHNVGAGAAPYFAFVDEVVVRY